MNKKRFGAILVSEDRQTDFYLSHRVVLTVPRRGAVHAVSFEQFGKCRVFARNGVAVSFFDAMMRTAEVNKKFENSLEMINFSLDLPEKSDFDSLSFHMKEKHGAEMEDFEIKDIRS